MFATLATLQDAPPHDVCVVGTGPVGIALALACEERGLSVLALESGGLNEDGFAASLATGHIADEARHATPSLTMRRGYGGTSRWWGGRCVPLDAIDFGSGNNVFCAEWPIQYDDVARWHSAAATFFGIAPAVFDHADEPWTRLRDINYTRLERWTPNVDIGKLYHDRLAKSKRVKVVLGATVSKLHFDEAGHRVTGLTVANRNHATEIQPARIVLACGGLETTRQLLVAQSARPELFGGAQSVLGQYYMGHLSGKIADIVLSDQGLAKDFDYYIHKGAYTRRRFTLGSEIQSSEGLGNIALWADNPPFHQPDHRNGVLSAAWLALAIKPIGRLLVSEGNRLKFVGPRPYRWADHLRNVLSSPFKTAEEMSRILYNMYVSRPRKPSFLLRSDGGRYSLHYHAEQSPNRRSTIKLSNRIDALGTPYLDIDLQFQEFDAELVVRAHQILDKSLRDSGLGRLEYHCSDETVRHSVVLNQADDGFHQLGTTRMGNNKADSVVDTNSRIHDVENLYVASSSVFPTSGQANPTFPTVALAIRLAAHLADTAGNSN